ncbi:MAG: hypothetical protein Q3976_04875 [Corynebacterium sp.]|nr:hypothetical protein [Corynebacterium sp.]
MAPIFPYRFAGVHDDVAARKRLVPLEELKSRAHLNPPQREVGDILARPGVAIIAELKGLIDVPEQTANAHLRSQIQHFVHGGASMLSGCAHPYDVAVAATDFAFVRGLCELPLVSRDIVVDPYQLHELRSYGVDMVTIRASLLNDDHLTSLVERTRDLNMRALVEVETLDDACRAAQAGAEIIGVNARDTHNQTLHPERFAEIKPVIDARVQMIALSGISTVEDLIYYRRHGAAAASIGTALHRDGFESSERNLRRFVAAGVHPAFATMSEIPAD